MSKILQGITIVLLIVLIVIMRDIRGTLRTINYSTLDTQNIQLNKIKDKIDIQEDLIKTTNTKLYNVQLYLDEIDDILNDKFYGNIGNNTQGLTQ